MAKAVMIDDKTHKELKVLCASLGVNINTFLIIVLTRAIEHTKKNGLKLTIDNNSDVI